MRSTIIRSVFLVLFTGALSSMAMGQDVKTTRITIESIPAGANVSLLLPGGHATPLGVTPIKDLELPRGVQRLELKKSGHEDLQVRVEIGRRPITLAYTLAQLPAAARLVLRGDAIASGAEVTLDGRSAGRMPLDLETSPGRHRLVVFRPGYQVWERWLELSEGQWLSLDIRLTEKASTFGTLVVQSSPSGAEVFIGDRGRGQTPLVLGDLEVGGHQVTVRREGFAEQVHDVILVAGETARLDVNLVAPPPPSGRLEVSVDVSGAQVYVDGQAQGMAPITVEDLSAGPHQVEARLEGYPMAGQEVLLAPGGRASIILSLEAARARTTGSIRVAGGVPGAIASVAGRKETLPAVFSNLSPGEHDVTVEAEGHLSVTERVTLEAGVELALTAELKPAGRLEVESVDGPGAEVHIDGDLVGSTPWTRDLAAGEYDVQLFRDGELRVHRHVEVTHGVTLVLREDTSGEAHTTPARPMGHGAAPLGVERGIVDLAVGWPHLLSVRVMGGILEDLDLGLAFRSMLHVINEFEGQVRYRFFHRDRFHLGFEGRVGFGVGHEQRNGVFMGASLRATVLFGDLAALTFHAGFAWYSDQVEVGGSRDTWVQTPLGVALDVRVATGLNVFICFEADPVPGRRALYDQSFFASPESVPDLQASVGVSFLF